ncbi:MAG: tripartite tricarboxylate transporter TctB family protein [Burkholderiales bacterium]|nr:tripartite tricarboxylate transporter TctB family protein [Burkholderiales bacterium]
MTAAITLFLFGAVTAALSLQLTLGTLRAPGSGLFPLVLGVLLMGLAAGHGIQLYLARARAPAAPKPAGSGAESDRAAATWRVVLFMGVVALATALLETAGFVVVSFFMMLGLLWILGLRKLQVSGPIALGTAILSELVFVYWLRIPLPAGWIGF